MSLGAEVSLGSVAMEPGSFQLPPSDLIELYLSADAFVMSSLLEGFSSALIEAMAAELPVIATDAPGCREFHGDALLVPTRSPAALAAAMRTVLEDEATRGALVAKSRARAAEFTWPRAVEAYLGLYRQLGAGAARP